MNPYVAFAIGLIIGAVVILCLGALGGEKMRDPNEPEES